MSKNVNQIDALIAELAVVRDEDLAGEARSAHAAALFASITETPVEARRGGTSRRRFRLLALAAGLALAVVLSTAALGIGQDVVSWLAGSHDPDAPVPMASDVIVASGKAGVPWRIVATPSDQGVCLFTVIEISGDRQGSGNCGYTDIRGDLPPDLRGDPASRCISTPTTVVPCGSLPRHWLSPPGGGGLQGGLERIFTYGLLAEKVASVELVLTDGERVRAHVVERPDGLPLNFYWRAFPCPLRPYAGGLQECVEDAAPEVEMAIARNAEGEVLERRVPVWNGNPTGDPNGPAPPTEVP